MAAENETEFRNSVVNIMDMIDVAGCGSLLHLASRDHLLQTLKRFMLLGRLKEAFDQ